MAKRNQENGVDQILTTVESGLKQMSTAIVASQEAKVAKSMAEEKDRASIPISSFGDLFLTLPLYETINLVGDDVSWIKKLQVDGFKIEAPCVFCGTERPIS